MHCAMNYATTPSWRREISSALDWRRHSRATSKPTSINRRFGLTNLPMALSLYLRVPFEGIEPSLWDDEHSDDMHALLEENARLRRLLAQLQRHPQKRG